jgi:hypothetical protein
MPTEQHATEQCCEIKIAQKSTGFFGTVLNDLYKSFAKMNCLAMVFFIIVKTQQRIYFSI